MRAAQGVTRLSGSGDGLREDLGGASGGTFDWDATFEAIVAPLPPYRVTSGRPGRGVSDRRRRGCWP